jgi:hypothetical protein
MFFFLGTLITPILINCLLLIQLWISQAIIRGTFAARELFDKAKRSQSSKKHLHLVRQACNILDVANKATCAIVRVRMLERERNKS